LQKPQFANPEKTPAAAIRNQRNRN
jgi:hypothetical protein